jgi:hypothetical protein
MTRGQCIPSGAHGTDRQVAHLTQGDYEEMAYSPGGRYLVLADRVEHRDTVVNQLVLYDFDRQRLDTILTASAARRYVHYTAIVFDFAWQGDSMLVAAYHDGDVGEIRVTLRVPDGHRISEEYDEVGIDMPPVEVVEAVMRLYPEARGVGPESTTVFDYALSGPTIRGGDFIVFAYRVSPLGYGVWLYGLTRRRIEQLQALPDTAARYGFLGGFADGEDVLFLSGGDTRRSTGVTNGGHANALRSQTHGPQLLGGHSTTGRRPPVLTTERPPSWPHLCNPVTHGSADDLFVAPLVRDENCYPSGINAEWLIARLRLGKPLGRSRCKPLQGNATRHPF